MTISRRDMLKTSGVAAALSAGVLTEPALAQGEPPPVEWTHQADVVVVGSGAMGIPAAIVAREAGCSVIIVETQPDIGGHAICSGGNVPLGGGTSRQKKYGIADSPDLLFRDLTDWSVVEPNGFPDYRYNDRELIRAFADHNVAAFDFLVAHGVVFIERPPDARGGNSVGNSVPRENHCAVMDWPMVQTGAPAEGMRNTTSSGNGLMRPLEAAARRAGVQILLEHRMTHLFRERPFGGRVYGIAAEFRGAPVTIGARKAVILGTGGSSSNVNFRRMFNPHLTEEYCGVAGQPWSNQDASGELAGLAVGASLWGLYNQTGEFGYNITKPGTVGSQYGYRNLQWMPGSPVFDKAHAIGLKVKSWQNLILVNMVGNRFYDETAGQYPANDYRSIEPYIQRSYLNAEHNQWNPSLFLDAAMAGIGDAHNGGGPIWAVFDADAAARERWDPKPPYVDAERGFFFAAGSLAELASKIQMKYQRVRMPPEALEATVTRYNGFVEAGADADFGKSRPLYKMTKPPFYAAWATPVLHDTRAGLRINAKGQVIDMAGEIIPGLYAGGECAGGFSQHGLARALCQGYIAGRNAAREIPHRA
jgi:succinate dehydrogenase/fumarate reductase flavoprotein subunit